MRIRVAVVATVALALGAGLAWHRGKASAAPEPPRIRGDFALLADDGRAVRWSSLRGRPRLVFFGFTHCPDACPVTLAKIAAVLDQPGAPVVQTVFITVDPERDTAPVMSAYVAAWKGRVLGLTGTPAQVASAARAFGVYYRRIGTPGGEEPYMLEHTATLFLVGPDDRLLEIIPYDVTAADLARVIRERLG